MIAVGVIVVVVFVVLFCFVLYCFALRLLSQIAPQRLCASACTVQPLPGDHGKELQIQGTFDSQAIQYLSKTFGIEGKYIEKK